jgi:surfactin synthase thioesterase subunit
MKKHGLASIDSTNWVVRPKPNYKANLRLFCFPYGGGGASYYSQWRDQLLPSVELCCMQLPGRESRFREKPFTHLMTLVEALELVIGPYLDMPFVFFGHSMGALIAFELARELQRNDKNGLLHLFVSGRKAPHIARSDPPKHNLPDLQFVEAIRDFNGTPELIFQEPELREMFLPVLRADFSILETYVYEDSEPIGCPINAFGGLRDKTVPYKDLEAWRQHTTNTFNIKMFIGGHFYLKDEKAQLLKEINRVLKKVCEDTID